jgi:hypothetical protein
MKDSEIYPVSFFSRAFDLMQKIQSDFHMLEADQVEMFAAQMKKHQALILSIHRQMRNIEGVTPAVSPDAHGNPTVKITDDPVEAPPVKFSTTKRPARPIPNPPPVFETAKTTGESTITRPVTIEENPTGISPAVAKEDAEKIHTPENNEIEVILSLQGISVGKNNTPEAGSRNITTPNAVTAKSNAVTAKNVPPPPSLNEAIEKRSLSDLRRAFSLNDRFRYRRELFGGDEEIMNKVISVLNGKESYKESIRFLDEKLHWDFSNPTVKDFIKILEMRFL